MARSYQPRARVKTSQPVMALGPRRSLEWRIALIQGIRTLGRYLVAVTFLVAILIGGVPPRAAAQAGADFSRYVAVGDGFTAGFQDGALHAASQQTSYVTFIAGAAATPLALPLVGEPGLPTPNTVTGLGLLVQRPNTCEYLGFDLATGRSVGRIDPSVTATCVAVPFQTAALALEQKWSIVPGNPNDPDTFEDFVLGYPYTLHGGAPMTQIETAVALEPTFVTVWLGPTDVYNAVVAADVNPATLTSPEDFDRKIGEAIDALAATGARGAVLNVPYATSTAVLLSQKDIRQRTGLTSKQVKNRLGVLKSSFVTINSLRSIDRIAAGLATGPLTDDEILTAQEMDRITTTIDAYNAILAARARRAGWALVDLNALYARYEKRGVDVPGAGTLTTRYLGGLYGLDGLYPSNTGQALIAVAVLSAINEKYGTALPLPNVAAVAASDPHVCTRTF